MDNEKKMKGATGTSFLHFLSTGRMKILKLGKYPHWRADQFSSSYIFDWAHTGTYIGEKHVFWVIFQHFVLWEADKRRSCQNKAQRRILHQIWHYMEQ